MKEIKFDSISPLEGFVGTVIEARVGGASAHKQRRIRFMCLAELLLLYRTAGPTVATSEAKIVDTKTYTTFSIQVPHELKHDESYSFSIILFPITEGEGKESYILDSEPIVFIVVSSPDLPKINTLMPTMIPLRQLTSTVLVITGEDLDKLNKARSPQLQSQPPLTFNYVNLDQKFAKLKLIPQSIAAVQPGSYALKFTTIDNKMVVSRQRITLR